jgi:hypothetical protein
MQIPLQQLRSALGQTLIQLSSACTTLIAADDGNNWLCFPSVEAEANMALFQNGSRDYLSSWIEKA